MDVSEYLTESEIEKIESDPVLEVSDVVEWRSEE